MRKHEKSGVPEIYQFDFIFAGDVHPPKNGGKRCRSAGGPVGEYIGTFRDHFNRSPCCHDNIGERTKHIGGAVTTVCQYVFKHERYRFL